MANVNGLELMPPAFSAGLDVWSNQDGRLDPQHMTLLPVR
jgi:hypothetical protein